MKTKTKKVLSVLLAFVLIFTAVPFVGIDLSDFSPLSFKAEAVNDGYFSYSYSSVTGNAMITNFDELYSGELVIPDTLGGYPVTRIYEEAFHGCDKITSVTIPASIKTIDRFAFTSCSKLTEVKFEAGSQLESIGDRAFEHCSNLKSITIPKSVTSIYENPFTLCSSLTAINVEAGNTAYVSDGGALFNIAKTTLINYPAKSTATTYTVPASVKEIKNYAFFKAEKLTAINFEANSQLDSIGGYVFSGCSNIKSITIPKSVTSIGPCTFTSCEKLSSINVEDGNKAFIAIDDALIYKVKDLARLIAYPAGKNITSITIPAVVTEIEYATFAGFERLVSVDFEEGSKLETIGLSAFEGCKSLKTITFPKSLKEIGGTFLGCKALTTVKFEEGSKLETIGAYTFNECALLESITIPASVTYIGVFAFGSCSKLSKVEFEKDSKLQNISTQAFYRCNALKSVKLPASVTSIGLSAFGDCYSLTKVEFEKNNSLASVNDKAFEPHNENLIIYGYTGSYEEDYADRNDIYFIALDAVHVHSYKLQDEVKPTCTTKGAKAYSCYCGHSYIEEVAATGHNYVNGICQNCGDDATAKCSCNCHKSGFSGFFWKIQLIIYKLFRMNDTCACGVAHY